MFLVFYHLYDFLFSCVRSLGMLSNQAHGIPAATRARATNRLLQHCIHHYLKRIPVLSADVVRQTVVEECADVHEFFGRIESDNYPLRKWTILEYILHFGTLESVSALLLSPLPMKFTMKRDPSVTLLEVLARRPNEEEEEVLAILDLIVSRLVTHSEDRERFHDNHRFLSAAAKKCRLSIFWRKFKHFLPSDVPIKVTRRVPLEDFKRLPVKDRDRFKFTKGVEPCADATEELISLFIGSDNNNNNPDVGAVTGCVQAYANVCAVIPGTTWSVLHMALRECSVECVAALLVTPLPLPCVCDRFQTLCERHDVEEIKEVLQLVLARLRRCPNETTNFKGFLRHAGMFGVLSDVWPIIRDFHPLRGKLDLFGVWADDWERLGGLKQQHFILRAREPTADIYTGDRNTAALARLSCSRSPDPLLVEHYVRRGASVNMIWYRKGILSNLCKSGSVAALAAALQTKETIDFRIRGSIDKSTILHDLCAVNDKGIVAAMLDLVVRRLQTHPEDLYDFSLTDRCGVDFLSQAAFYGCLAMCWSKVKDFPYYADNLERIPLRNFLIKEDLELLGDEINFFCWNRS